MGDKNIRNALQIVLTGEKVKISPIDWKNTLGHFSGKVIPLKGRPAILVKDPAQLGLRLEI